MSERAQQLRENFEANKAANEQADFERALYGKALDGDTSDESEKRIDEAEEYEDRLQKLTQRGDEYDPFMPADNETSRGFDTEWDDAIAQNEQFDQEKADVESAMRETIANDPRLRRMANIAHEISVLREEKLNDKNNKYLGKKLDRRQIDLNDLLIAYSESEGSDPAIIDFIVDSTVAKAEVTPAPEQRDESEPANDESSHDGETAPSVESSEQADETDEERDSMNSELDEERIALNDETESDGGDIEEDEPREDLHDDESAESEDEEDEPRAELNPEDPEHASDEHEEESDSRRPSLWQRARNRYTQMVMNRIAKPESDDSSFAESKRGTKKQRNILLGTVGIMAAAGAAVVAYKFGYFGNHSGTAADIASNSPTGNSGGPSVNAAERAGTFGGGQPQGYEFSSSASTVRPGEGWYETFNDMNIPKDEWNKLLQKAGPKLAEKNWAYKMADGSWGMSRPGQMPKDMLELIQNNR